MTAPTLRMLIPLAGTVALGLAAGCTLVELAVDGFNHGATTGANALGTRREREEPIHVAVAGPVAIDVELFAGNVAIEVDPKLTEATVRFTRVATHGSGRTDEAKASLVEISSFVDLVPSELGQTLVVRAETTCPEPWFQRADVLLRVPEAVNLRVRTRGAVEATNIAGAIDVHSGGGEVRIATERAITRPVSVINDAGTIVFRVSGASRGAIDAQAVRGRVMHVVREGSMTVEPGTAHDRLLGVFNRGDNPILLRAADGDVKFASVEAPTRVGVLVVD